MGVGANLEEHETRGALLVAVHAEALDLGHLLVGVQRDIDRLGVLVLGTRAVLLVLFRRCSRSRRRRGSRVSSRSRGSLVCGAHDVCVVSKKKLVMTVTKKGSQSGTKRKKKKRNLRNRATSHTAFFVFSEFVSDCV